MPGLVLEARRAVLLLCALAVDWIFGKMMLLTEVLKRYQAFAAPCSDESTPQKGAWTMCQPPCPSTLLRDVGGTSSFPLIRAGETVTGTGKGGLFCTALNGRKAALDFPCEALEIQPPSCR